MIYTPPSHRFKAAIVSWADSQRNSQLMFDYIQQKGHRAVSFFEACNSTGPASVVLGAWRLLLLFVLFSVL